MDRRLIFRHRQWRLKTSGRWLERERPTRWPYRKIEGIYDPEVPGKTAEKSRCRTKLAPVLKLTQVGVMNILRRSRERS